MVQELMKQNNLSMYRLSKNSGIPYTTVSDICTGKAQLEKCSAETVFRLSRELGVTMETLLEAAIQKRPGFELFKSNVCHRLKELGDIDFIIEVLEKDEIRRFYNMKWYPESLYLLAMLDYISRVNDVPLCDEYDDLRGAKLNRMVYPASVVSMAAVAKSEEAKLLALEASIPEFLRFNIIESEIRNVV